MSKILLYIWGLLFYLVPNFAIDTVGLMTDHIVMPGYHIGDALPNKHKKT